MPLVALVVIAVVSFIIVRIGATALTMTGLARDVAEFQSVSAFFGVGFTTGEAELVVNAQRCVGASCKHLIIMGNLGITSAVAGDHRHADEGRQRAVPASGGRGRYHPHGDAGDRDLRRDRC